MICVSFLGLYTVNSIIFYNREVNSIRFIEVVFIVVKIMSCQWKQKMTLMGMISDEKVLMAQYNCKKTVLLPTNLMFHFFLHEFFVKFLAIS